MNAPATASTNPQERFPRLQPHQMTEAQRRYVQDMQSGPRGNVTGPFVPLLHAPQLANRIQKVGEYLRFESSIPPAIIELVILLTARHWNCHYEWQFHSVIGREAGLTPGAIDAIARNQIPQDLTPAQRAAYDFCRSVHYSRQVDDESFAHACSHFGHEGCLELLALCGYYAMLAMVLNTANFLPPEGSVLPCLQA